MFQLLFWLSNKFVASFYVDKSLWKLKSSCALHAICQYSWLHLITLWVTVLHAIDFSSLLRSVLLIFPNPQYNNAPCSVFKLVPEKNIDPLSTKSLKTCQYIFCRNLCDYIHKINCPKLHFKMPISFQGTTILMTCVPTTFTDGT